MTQLLQTLLSGLTTGAIYGLIALGFTIVFNATKVTNFANGDFVMMGGVVCAGLVTLAHWPLLLAVPATIVGVTALGAALDVFGIQRARRKTVLSLAMITIGFSVLYRGLMQVLVGRDVMFAPSFGIIPDIRTAELYVGSQSLWILLALGLISGGLSYLFLKTRLGKAMRAASQSPRAAALCGIDPRLMSIASFAMAAAVGAIAGALIAPIGAAFYDYGLVFGLKGFAAAVLGGFGSPVGAVVGGLLLGLMESISAGYLASAYKDAVALAILLGLLLVWPSGLFGRVEARRV
ncbi:branched-chain amino acid ABC transporter permease [Chelatococcus reniformis]|uniref:Branched-chain amino acid ABC transporter permease n=1 Tax=Chelatococcus reniformis TaxID=1494448 RepID=A0A916ULQ0_9HYPH|nr:branched-chain amino acid ABC transporter permease [Chelatococcus reniformis]GGC77893.1 branched-chain amino acid ABC transporter permease [Chelatococcus reniformis]